MREKRVQKSEKRDTVGKGDRDGHVTTRKDQGQLYPHPGRDSKLLAEEEGDALEVLYRSTFLQAQLLVTLLQRLP